MNARLNKLYEEIYDVEDSITDCEQRKLTVEQEAVTRDNILQMLLSFDRVFDTMSKEDQRQLLESMIAEVHLHPKETWEEGKNPIKEIQYTFPIFNGEDKSTLGENLASVETIILVTRQMEDV